MPIASRHETVTTQSGSNSARPVPNALKLGLVFKIKAQQPFVLLVVWRVQNSRIEWEKRGEWK